MNKYFKLFSIVVFLLFHAVKTGDACTNILVTKGASKDGSTMVSYSADSHTRYGVIVFTPSGHHKPGDVVDIYEIKVIKKALLDSKGSVSKASDKLGIQRTLLYKKIKKFDIDLNK